VGEIKALTSLRGLFAIWVVFFHLRAWSEFSDKPMLVIDRGYLGVDFFFLLSGFILAGRHAAEFAAGYSVRMHAGFALKRIGRLFPLHLAVLTGVIAGIVLRGEPLYWWTHIASEALLIHRWGLIHTPRAALNGPDWSISTEWAANLLFPLFVLATGSSARSVLRPIGFASLALCALAFVDARHGSMDIGQANSVLPLIRCFAEFGIGMILFQHRQRFEAMSGDLWVLAAVLLILVGLYLRADLLVVAAMIPLLPMIALNARTAGGLLASGPPHFLGVISYSIYLIQLPIILEIDRATAASRWAAYLHWALPPAVIVVVAACTYWLIERPCNTAIRSLGHALGRFGTARNTAEI
jgi:peptidoglycan/LPS O-acetylase OafA/YrhL